MWVASPTGRPPPHWARTPAAKPATSSPAICLDSAEVICGTWQQPAAVVRAGPQGGARYADVARHRRRVARRRWTSASSARRRRSTSILGDQPALLLQCTRRIGGWPQVALVASVDGRTWLADGILPTLPVMERSIGILSGRVAPGAADAAAVRGRCAAGQPLAARAFGAGDVGQFDDADDARRPRQPGGEFRPRRASLSRGTGGAAEGAGAGRSGYRRTADAPGVAGLRPGPLRRGGHAVRAGGDAGAGCHSNAGWPGSAAALSGVARAEPGAVAARPCRCCAAPTRPTPRWCHPKCWRHGRRPGCRWPRWAR